MHFTIIFYFYQAFKILSYEFKLLYYNLTIKYKEIKKHEKNIIFEYLMEPMLILEIHNFIMHFIKKCEPVIRDLKNSLLTNLISNYIYDKCEN